MFSLPKLLYPYEALEPYIDQQTMRIHHDKHHGTYVDNLNKSLAGHDEFLNMDLASLMVNLEKVPQEIRTKVKRNGGQHYNHSLFWKIMGPVKVGEPQGKLSESLAKTFGSFSSFQKAFTQEALNRFGSGWVWLSKNEGALEVSSSPNEENPLMQEKKPLLCLDVWEHAYYLKYQNRRADYIMAWWNVVNWQEVERIFQEK